MSAVSAASSSGLVGFLRCVDRCCPRTRQASRSETPCLATTSSTHARRRAGLRSFTGAALRVPLLLPLGSTSQSLDQRPLDVTDCSRPQAPSGASPDRPSSHRTQTVICNMLLPSPLSIGSLPKPAGLVPLKPQPAATWRQSLQAYVSSCSFSVLHRLKSHTSGRITFQGADQVPFSRGPL